MKKGFLVIISAPSGGGKTTICRSLLRRNPELVYSVSATTRPPRKSEKDGADYFFLKESEFKKRITQERFAEWAIVHNNYYGTPRRFVDQNVKQGKVVICDIDVQGGEKIMQVYPEAVKIFIIPPTWEEL
ncbi:MAG: guanylate kinase, partial [bacterium]|nr:guanylate kinase [bacterium]